MKNLNFEFDNYHNAYVFGKVNIIYRRLSLDLLQKLYRYPQNKQNRRLGVKMKGLTRKMKKVWYNICNDISVNISYISFMHVNDRL